MLTVVRVRIRRVGVRPAAAISAKLVLRAPTAPTVRPSMLRSLSTWAWYSGRTYDKAAKTMVSTVGT